MDGSKHISTDFSLYGLGDGENLFSDLETLLPSENKSAFGGAADVEVAVAGQCARRYSALSLGECMGMAILLAGVVVRNHLRRRRRDDGRRDHQHPLPGRGRPAAYYGRRGW